MKFVESVRTKPTALFCPACSTYLFTICVKLRESSDNREHGDPKGCLFFICDQFYVIPTSNYCRRGHREFRANSRFD